MTALYNEIDAYAADWLEALIARGLIAPGVVDRRSVEDLPPDYVAQFNQVHLFAGIGVWSYAARLAGLDDTRSFWTLSCPCQPFSAAGKGGGFTDERHLWPAAFHLIEQCRPRRLYGEQVADRGGLAWLDLVSADLEGTGYAFGAVDTCSAGFGAPHRRQRLRFAAMDNARLEGLEGHARNGRGVVGWPSTARPVAEASISSVMADNSGVGREMALLDSRGGDAAAGVRQANVGGSDGASGRLADDNGVRLEQITAPGFRTDAERDAQSCGGAGGMDNAERDRRGTWRDDHTVDERQQLDTIDLFGGLADTAKPGRLARWRIGETSGRRDETRVEPRRLCDACGLADDADIGRNIGTGFCNCGSTGLGRNVVANSGATVERPRPTNGFWRAADWLLCRDPSGPKWRPVEPGTFPLAHGAPSRVGRLRAYGNAVDAQATKAFIEAAL